jgi:hypothetical protein
MFIELVGDADAMTLQKSSDFSAAIGFGTHHPSLTFYWSTSTLSFDRATRHLRFKPKGFVALARAQYTGHQLFCTCRSNMPFGAEAALASTSGFHSFRATQLGADELERSCHRHSE